jgi:UDP-N-acetylmuramoyl-tripeptide--D-alanyl-D-alanine ligase
MVRTLTLGEIAAICGGTVSEEWAQVTASGVTTDTRSLQRRQLFVALKGERHDGHEWVREALAAGAAGVVISRSVNGLRELPTVLVRDTLEAYGQLAAHHRAQLGVRVVGVTGSSGKTTTKNAVGAVLARVGPTRTAPGTENNEIGVPRFLLSLEEGDRFAVVEMAMRGPGEIGYLARLARPQIGVITNIGEAHVGRLGGRERLAQAKAELLAELPTDGVAVLNADDFFFGLLSEMAPCPIISFGLGAEADVTALEVRPDGLQGMRFTLQREDGAIEVALRLPGRHNVANALAAAAVGLAVGATLEQTREGLEVAAAEQMRGQVLQTNGSVTILNDAYNANPDSMAAALAVLSGAQGRKLAVLGDMLELGERADGAHRQLGIAAAEAGVERLVAVGKLAALAAQTAGAQGVRADAVESVEEAVALLRPELRAGDTVLVKASRALALERVVEGLLDDA